VCLGQQGGQQGPQELRLARAGGTSDEQVRHLAEVGQDRPAVAVSAPRTTSSGCRSPSGARSAGSQTVVRCGAGTSMAMTPGSPATTGTIRTWSVPSSIAMLRARPVIFSTLTPGAGPQPPGRHGRTGDRTGDRGVDTEAGEDRATVAPWPWARGRRQQPRGAGKPGRHRPRLDRHGNARGRRAVLAAAGVGSSTPRDRAARSTARSTSAPAGRHASPPPGRRRGTLIHTPRVPLSRVSNIGWRLFPAPSSDPLLTGLWPLPRAPVGEVTCGAASTAPSRPKSGEGGGATGTPRADRRLEQLPASTPDQPYDLLAPRVAAQNSDRHDDQDQVV
jgi:hypothetical protein